jgi:hypothetical protein
MCELQIQECLMKTEAKHLSLVWDLQEDNALSFIFQ